MCFFFVFQIFLCVRVCIIIKFIKPFRQMPVNTRRQTAGLSPLIKVSQKTCKKEFWVTPKFDEDTKAQGKRSYYRAF
jgi:hypothetical protein